MRVWGGPRPMLGLFTALLMATSVVLVAPAANAGGDRPGGGWTRNSVTVAGYDDYQTDRTVDVVNRTGGNNLVFWFTAGRALVDGTLTIELPAAAWATPLHATENDGQSRLYLSNVGAVGVRPAADLPGPGDPARYCRLGTSYTLPDGTAHAYVFELTVTNTDRVRRIEAAHLNCAAGQRIAIRIVGLTAPQAGLARFSVGLSDSTDAAGSRWVADPGLVVKPTPTVRLVIDDLKPTISADPDKYVTKHRGKITDFGVPVRVRAVGPTGRPLPNYSAAIRMYTSPLDCAVLNKGFKDFPTTRFSGPTTLLFPFTQAGRYAVVAEDIDNRALPATSNLVTVVDGTTAPTCPASYH